MRIREAGYGGSDEKAIAEGLKELCHHKDFNKISVRDITEQCGLNRQTFYYHFQDKYELLDWIYYQEGFVYLASDVTLTTGISTYESC